MRFEMLVGLVVSNDEIYQAYREAMAPILADHRGGFGCDFNVSHVLKAPTDCAADSQINRLFTIFFATEELKNEFFNNDDYLKIKSQFFENSVSSTSIIASYWHEN